MVETLFKDKMESIWFLPPKMGPFQALSLITIAHTSDIIGSSGNRYIFPVFDNIYSMMRSLITNWSIQKSGAMHGRRKWGQGAYFINPPKFKFKNINDI